LQQTVNQLSWPVGRGCHVQQAFTSIETNPSAPICADIIDQAMHQQRMGGQQIIALARMPVGRRF